VEIYGIDISWYSGLSVADTLVAIIAALTTIALGAFAVRRIVLVTAASSRSRPEQASAEELPSVTLLVPARDEAETIGGTLAALEKLAYPPEQLFIVLIDDGSMDDTSAHLERWVKDRPRTALITSPERRGKSAALKVGMTAAPPAHLIGICDADLRPRPQSLRILANAFRDDSAGAAVPFLSPANALQSGVASYAATESWLHQLVTSAGKDRLGLNPATNGATLYRRRALEEIGGFPQVTSGEDIWIATAMTRAGWKIRFHPEAVIDNTVVQSWNDYWKQHVRWSRNLFSSSAARSGASERAISIPQRIELLMQSAGYADRLAMLGAVVFAAIGRIPFWIPLLYGLVIAAQLVTALTKAGEGSRTLRFLAWSGVFYAVDVAATIASVFLHILRRPRRWTHAARQRPKLAVDVGAE
jgi:cellulose synthase/poly-beta-1,6-N-acetylglucosamine synthase-like glycosyltransferase